MARHERASRVGVGALAALVVGGAACSGAPATVHPPDALQIPQVGAAASPSPAPVVTKLGPREPPSAEEICGMPRGLVAEMVAGAHPFVEAEPPSNLDENNPFIDRVRRAPPPPRGDACFVSDDNLARAEAGSRGAKTLTSSTKAHDGKPLYLDRIASHLHLNDEESALLEKNGFVALDRIEYESYATAYHDVFQEELPIFVSIDSVLNSVFQANGSVLADIEANDLRPRFLRMMKRLVGTLASSTSRYGEQTTEDLDVYLAVAGSLFGNIDQEGHTLRGEVFPQDHALVESVVQRAKADEPALEPVEIFGRTRMIDFSQLTPRGHYAANYGYGAPSLDGYFRAVMWLSRFEWNLVSRSCRSSCPLPLSSEETPREARDAMALADLVSRAGAMDDLAAFERVYSVFAGRREDVSVPDLLHLMATAHVSPKDGDGPARLKAAIGERFARTARTHFMPEGSTTLPVIATLFGPRIVPDVAPLTRVVHDSVLERKSLGAPDVAYLLGHDRALDYEKQDLEAFPSLKSALVAARAELANGIQGRNDLYSLWLRGVVALAERPAPTSTTPSFMRTEAYRDFSMSSALVGYGQIRHNYVLLAAQGYDSYGCEIPDGYVEPALATYDALLKYVRAAEMTITSKESKAYWRRVREVLGMLRGIVVTELSGARLDDAQRRWLGMVSEYIPTAGYGDSGAPPKWTGWYFDLFPDRHHMAEKSPAFVADYFTLTNAGQVAYLGAERPRMGVFIIDVNGERRAMVGPVAKGYELKGPVGARLDDAKALLVPSEQKHAPWMTYLAPDVALPELTMTGASCPGDEERVILFATKQTPLGEVTLTLLDHHGDPVTEPLTAVVGAEPTLFTFHTSDALAKAAYGLEGAHVWIHELANANARAGTGRGDLTYGLRVYTSDGEFGETPALKRAFVPFYRASGGHRGPFGIGAMAPVGP